MGQLTYAALLVGCLVVTAPLELVLRHLPGLLTVLADGGFSDEEAFQWLFRPDDSLPGTPVQALRDDRHTEVTRRAQALAF